MQARSLSFNLEPTFRCNLECEMCPRFSSEDPHLDMSMETYDRIVEAMEFAHTVDFTGWGEPMLHPRIYSMIERARSHGCLTTMTSNGTVLNERNARRLIEAGMQRLTISIDGVTEETFNTIRLGASLARVTANLKQLSSLIAELGSDLELGIAFTLQEINAHELSLLVPWLRSVEARKLHLKQLNVISNREDWKRSFLKYRLQPQSLNGDRLKSVEAQLQKVRSEAEAAGMEVLLHSELPLNSQLKGRHCLATPIESLYVSFEGRVAPCCHFGHHVSRYFEGEQSPPGALFFGDLRQQSLMQIWMEPSFQDFREGFIREHFPEACRSCYLLYGK